MGYLKSGPAHAQADAEALDEALHAARGIGESFAQDWHDSTLSPAVSVVLDTGADDEPLFVFSLLVELDEDFDVDNYPEAEIEALRSDLRSRVPGTPVGDWRWLLATGTKAGAARR